MLGEIREQTADSPRFSQVITGVSELVFLQNGSENKIKR